LVTAVQDLEAINLSGGNIGGAVPSVITINDKDKDVEKETDKDKEKDKLASSSAASMSSLSSLSSMSSSLFSPSTAMSQQTYLSKLSTASASLFAATTPIQTAGSTKTTEIEAKKAEAAAAAPIEAAVITTIAPVQTQTQSPEKKKLFSCEVFFYVLQKVEWSCIGAKGKGVFEVFTSTLEDFERSIVFTIEDRPNGFFLNKFSIDSARPSDSNVVTFDIQGKGKYKVKLNTKINPNAVQDLLAAFGTQTNVNEAVDNNNNNAVATTTSLPLYHCNQQSQQMCLVEVLQRQILLLQQMQDLDLIRQ